MDLRDRLQSTLGSAYVIERELGGGGMSRVFLAHDTSLGRRIVVKLLPPELAGGVNVERFKREIQLAAQLQHPHIVPLLSASELSVESGDRLPFFTMPFVEGESLRQRIGHGELPITDIVSILRDVARALAHAHARGVIHRDIKPDNVLLTGGSAVVSDFGVAKAVGASTSESGLTSVGVALGTPAYMAPEQAAADPNVDHRADIYAFGVVAFEVLTGHTPFAGRSAGQMLAAHATVAPPPVAEDRPTTPPALAQLVMRCLEKRPADRPQSADEVLHALDAVTTPTVGTAPSTTAIATPAWRRRVGVIAAAAAFIAGASAVTYRFAFSHDANERRVVVMPFDNATNDSTLGVVGRMAADYITEGLSGLTTVEVVATNAAFAVSGSTAGVTSADRVREVAERTGARRAVFGTYYKQGDSLRFRAQVIEAASGKVLSSIDGAPATVSSPMPAIADVRGRVMTALGADQTNRFVAGSSRTPLYASYREFMAGSELFGRDQDYRAAIPHFRRAIELDPTFLAPYQFLSTAHYNLGEIGLTDSITRVITPFVDRMSPTERAYYDFALAEVKGDMHAAIRAMSPHVATDQIACYLVGYRFYQLNRQNEAIEQLDKCHDEKIRSGWLNFWTVPASARHLVGDYKGELEVIRRGRALYPTKSFMVTEEAAALVALGRAPEAIAIVDSLARNWDRQGYRPADVMSNVALELREWKHPDDALAMLRRAIGLYETELASGPKPVNSRRNLARLYYLTDQLDTARAMFAALAAADTNDIISRGMLGAIAARSGHRDDAVRISESLAALHVPYAFGATSHYRAVIAAQLGDRVKAAQLIEQAFAEGRPFSAAYHRDPDLESVRDSDAGRSLLKPKG